MSHERPSEESFNEQELKKYIYQNLGITSRKDIPFPNSNDYKKAIENNPEVRKDAEKMLKAIRDTWKQRGIRPSSVRIAASFVATQTLLIKEVFQANNISEFTPLKSNKRKLKAFLGLSDMVDGAHMIAHALMDAEEMITEDIGDKLLANFIPDPSNPNPQATAAQASFFLRHEASENAALLRSGPRGDLKAIDNVLRSIKNDSRPLMPYSTRAFVAEGAKFAGELYGLIYPLAEKVNRE